MHAVYDAMQFSTKSFGFCTERLHPAMSATILQSVNVIFTLVICIFIRSTFYFLCRTVLFTFGARLTISLGLCVCICPVLACNL